ncbi:MAG: hypothetical protein MZU97_19875 [Bacillus subtilis]|nr:hypothetical protein [Bacillus subtilis]
MYYHLQTDPAYEGAIETLFAAQDQLDEVLRHEIQIARKNLIKTKKIPVAEYVKYNELMATIYPVYVEAKQTNNYALYKPSSCLKSSTSKRSISSGSRRQANKATIFCSMNSNPASTSPSTTYSSRR